MPAYVRNSNKQIATFNNNPKKKKRKIVSNIIADRLYILIEVLREILRKFTPPPSLYNNKQFNKALNFFYKKQEDKVNNNIAKLAFRKWEEFNRKARRFVKISDKKKEVYFRFLKRRINSDSNISRGSFYLETNIYSNLIDPKL